MGIYDIILWDQSYVKHTVKVFGIHVKYPVFTLNISQPLCEKKKNNKSMHFDDCQCILKVWVYSLTDHWESAANIIPYCEFHMIKERLHVEDKRLWISNSSRLIMALVKKMGIWFGEVIKEASSTITTADILKCKHFYELVEVSSTANLR